MRRLLMPAVGAMLVTLTACGGETAPGTGAPASSSPAPEQAPAGQASRQLTEYDQPGRLALALRGRQQPNTAYLAIVLFRKANGACGAVTVPDKLIVPNPAGTSPARKAKVEWEVVNNCWTSGGPANEVRVKFAAGAPISFLQEVAEFPNPGGGAENRDTIRAKFADVSPAGTYPYTIWLKEGTNPEAPIADPEIEIEGT